MDEIEQQFLAAIAANPDDAEARSVYADWLEQRGDARAEYLRLEAVLFSGPARLLELMRSIDPAWLAAVTRYCDVVLVDGGSNKIGVIKVVREVTGLGLKDAKDLVDAPPKSVRTAISFDEANDIAAKLRMAGARVVVSPKGVTVDEHIAFLLRKPPPPPQQKLWITRVDPEPTRRIDAIKAVRAATGFGLKEAKDLVEAVLRGERRPIIVHGTREQAEDVAALLRPLCDVELS